MLLLLALPFWAAAQSPKGGNASQSAEYQKLKFEQFFDYLNARYVDTLNNETLVEEAITGILSALDPHSSYSSAEEMKSITESFDGSFSGIGVEFDVINDTIIVVNTVAGGPAESVGILPNDRIVSVDGQIVGRRKPCRRSETAPRPQTEPGTARHRKTGRTGRPDFQCHAR